ncbi:MAG TPA: ABC transporter permease, partial [Thermomicrobiales bacterium]|nr:ABC transporter permease [Thermomicrobiales bacterium]
MSVDISTRSRSTERLDPAAGPERAKLGSSTIAPDLVSKTPRTPWSIAVRRFRSSKLALFGLLVITLMALATIFADQIAPYGENEIDLFNITAQPSEDHVLGTDELGRDELSRLLYGGRISLSVGIGAALISTLLGIIVGAIAGYFGGWLDTVLMRFIDLMLAFPAIFLLLILFAIYGSSVLSVVLFLGLFSWMWLARVIRGEFLSLEQRDFVEAARSIGVPNGLIIRRHLLPNV